MRKVGKSDIGYWLLWDGNIRLFDETKVKRPDIFLSDSIDYGIRMCGNIEGCLHLEVASSKATKYNEWYKVVVDLIQIKIFN